VTPRWVVYDEPAGGGGGGGGPWDPSQLSSTKGWFSGDAVSGVSNGGSVSVWSNAVSGYGNLTTAPQSSPPTLDTAALNLKPVLRFDGTQALSNTGWDNSTTDEYTVFVVFQRLGDNGATGTAGLVYLGNNSPISGIIGYNVSGYSNPYLLNNNFSGGAYDSGFASTSLQFGWFIASSTRTNQSSGYTDVYLNGVLEALKSSTGSLSLSNNIELAQWSTPRRFDGQIAEFIYLNAAVATADREKIEGYLAHKWGLAGNLPVSHPYKNAAP